MWSKNFSKISVPFILTWFIPDFCLDYPRTSSTVPDYVIFEPPDILSDTYISSVNNPFLAKIWNSKIIIARYSVVKLGISVGFGYLIF